MKNYKKAYSYIEISIGIIIIILISLIWFKTYNTFNSIANSTLSIVKIQSSFEKDDIKKLKINKNNITWIYQLKNNINDNEALSLILDWNINISGSELWLGIVASNLNNNIWDNLFDIKNFNDFDYINPQIYIFSEQKLGDNINWINFIWNWTLWWDDKSINTFVYKVFDKKTNIIIADNTDINNPPTANDFQYWFNIWYNETTFDWKILSNANDIDSDILTASIISNWGKWTFSISWNNITYNYNWGGEWIDSCTILINDWNWWNTNIDILVSIDLFAPNKLMEAFPSLDTKGAAFTNWIIRFDENIGSVINIGFNNWWTVSVMWWIWTNELSIEWNAPNADFTYITITVEDEAWNQRVITTNHYDLY